MSLVFSSNQKCNYISDYSNIYVKFPDLKLRQLLVFSSYSCKQLDDGRIGRSILLIV
jgi:hypothetical protein